MVTHEGSEGMKVQDHQAVLYCSSEENCIWKPAVALKLWISVGPKSYKIKD